MTYESKIRKVRENSHLNNENKNDDSYKDIDFQDLKQQVNQGPLGNGQANASASDTFPVEALPAPCQSLINEAQKAQNLDPAFTGAAALAVLSTAIGNARQLQLKEKRHEHCTLFMGIVGRPGSGKTPAHKLIFEPLRDHDHATYIDYLNKRLVYDEWLNNKEEDRSEPPEQPSWKRRLLNDHTIEVLSDVLHENPRGICLYVDELATWFGSLNKYNAGSDQERWLSIWSLDHFTVDRKNRPPIKVSNPFCNVFGSIQPAVLPRLFNDEKAQNGFTDRILFATETPNRPPDKWQKGDINTNTIDNYKKLISQLYGLSAEQWEDGALKPGVLYLSNPAEHCWEAYYNKIQQEIHEASDSEAALLSKIEQYVPRMALILALGNNPSAQLVQEEDLQNAIKLGSYFYEQAKQVKEKAGVTEGIGNKALIKTLNDKGNNHGEIAKILGIGKGYISKVLNGKK